MNNESIVQIDCLEVEVLISMIPKGNLMLRTIEKGETLGLRFHSFKVSTNVRNMVVSGNN